MKIRISVLQNSKIHCQFGNCWTKKEINWKQDILLYKQSWKATKKILRHPSAFFVLVYEMKRWSFKVLTLSKICLDIKVIWECQWSLEQTILYVFLKTKDLESRFIMATVYEFARVLASIISAACIVCDL